MSINPQPVIQTVLGPRVIVVEMKEEVRENLRKIESIFDRTDLYETSEIFSMLKNESEIKIRLQEFQVDLHEMLFEPGHPNDVLSVMFNYNCPEIKTIVSGVGSLYEHFKHLGLYVDGSLRYDYLTTVNKWLIFNNNNGHASN